jgi:hypothetical protein
VTGGGEEAEGSRLERKGGSGRLVFFLSLSPLLVYETSALSSSQLLHASQPRHARASAGLESRRLTCNAKAHAAACLPVLPLLHKSGKTAVISLPPSIHPSAFPRLVLLVFLYRNLYHLLPLPGTYYKSSEKDMYIRASTLLHISCPIGRLMLCHIRFLVMWKRESKERKRLLPRETTASWAKQPPHGPTSQPLYELLLSCNL